MVYFTCNHCGSSLKKNNVEKHYSGQCRAPISVSCMDCMKDFHGQAYASHTKCITEDEKYSAKGYTSRPPSNKGEVKQNAWLELVKNVSESRMDIPVLERSLLSSLLKHENIPQKKAKFQNFAQNVWYPAKRNPKAVDFVWNLIETEQKAQKEAKASSDGKLNVDNEEPNCSDFITESLIKNKGTKERKCKQNKEKYEAKMPEMEGNEESDCSTEIGDKFNENKNEDKNNDIKCDVFQIKKLSSKEKKGKRKREKYESELLQIEEKIKANCIEIVSSIGANVEGLIDRKQKKQLKRKAKRDKRDAKVLDVSDNECQDEKNNDTMIPESERVTTTFNVKPDKANKKRKKTAELVSNENEAAAKKSKVNGDDIEPVSSSTDVKSSKFEWSKVIVDVLQSAQGHELPVKRLRKKVLAEYASTGKAVDFTINAKFNKKLSKIPVVLLLKDRAKLKIA